MPPWLLDFDSHMAVSIPLELDLGLSAAGEDRPAVALSPFFICRLSGVPATDLGTLHAEETLHQAAQLDGVSGTIQALQEPISNALFALVPRAPGKRERSLLIGLRRALFNGKLSSRAVDELGALIPAATRAQIDRHQALVASRDELARQLPLAYERDLLRMRRTLREWMRDERFLAGVLLSSPDLHASAKRYFGCDLASLRSRDAQIERGLLRYFTRAAMKATPFATFCTVVPGRIAGGDLAERWSFRGSLDDRFSRVRLNKRLYGVVLQYLLATPEIRESLPLELNSSLRRAGASWLFLSEIDGKEVCQRVNSSPSLDAVIREVGAPSGRCTRDLVADFTVGDAAFLQYLERLINIGVLRYTTGVRDQDADWDVTLGTTLALVPAAPARNLRDRLVRLRCRVEEYERAAFEDRVLVARAIEAETREALESMAIPPRAIESTIRGLLLYEDASARASVTLSKHGLERAEHTLSRLAIVAQRISPQQMEQATMRSYFDATYGPSVAEVPLLQFYEDYHRDHYKVHLAKVGPRPNAPPPPGSTYDRLNPLGLASVEAIRGARNAIAALVRRRWAATPNADEVVIRMEEVERACASVPERSLECFSVATFAQIIEAPRGEDCSRILVQDAKFFTGFGKYFSRFLYLCSEAERAGVRNENLASTDEILAELTADALFNGNLHPPLVPFDLGYPTGTGTTGANQVACGELVVRRTPNHDASLCLWHSRLGRNVHVVDLGFLNPLMRPALFRLLLLFTPTASTSLPIPSTHQRVPEYPVATPGAGTSAPEHAVSVAAPDVHEVRCRPRISVDGVVVLARRRWSFSPRAWPARRSGESDVAFFDRVVGWARSEGLPDHGYIRIEASFDERSKQTNNTTAALPTTSVGPGFGSGTVDASVVAPSATSSLESVADPSAIVASSPSTGTRLRRARTDLHKPQYLSFRNPLLIDLVDRTIRPLTAGTVVIEECLPDHSGGPASEGKCYAEEVVLQLIARRDQADAD